MADRDRDERGRYTSEFGPADLFAAMAPFEPYTTRELADEVGIARRTALNYLDELAADGRIRKKKPEPRRAIWIRSSDDTDADEGNDDSGGQQPTPNTEEK